LCLNLLSFSDNQPGVLDKILTFSSVLFTDLGNIENRQKLLLDKISNITKSVKRTEEKVKILSKTPGWLSEKDNKFKHKLINGKSVIPKDINSSLKKKEESYSQDMNQLNEI
jgi:archaellum component FlaC